LDAAGLRQFVLQQSRTTGWAAAKSCTTALRMFLRFLIAEGRCRADLLGAIPVVAHWRLAALPRYLPAEDVGRLISSCEQSSPVGIRDRAILLLLARLGLRAGDIVQMRLQDIDWKGAWIQVSGKNRRQTRLPLNQEVGGAIVSYLQKARPQSTTMRCSSVVVLLSGPLGRTVPCQYLSTGPYGAPASHAPVVVPPIYCGIRSRVQCCGRERRCSRFRSCCAIKALRLRRFTPRSTLRG